MAGAVAVVVLVALLTWAGLGPLASGPQVPTAEFEAGDHGDPVPLALSDVAARTVAPGDDAGSATAIVDGDPTTAWRSAGDPPQDDGPLDTIDLVLDEPAWVERLELRNGDHRDRDAYDASSALRQVRLTFDGGEVVIADLLDLGLGVQEIVLPEPLLTTVLRIDVLERVAGPHDQLAVSGLELHGWVARGDDVELAIRRAEADPATGPRAPGIPTGLGGLGPQPRPSASAEGQSS